MDYLRPVRTGLLVLAAAAGITIFAVFALKTAKTPIRAPNSTVSQKTLSQSSSPIQTTTFPESRTLLAVVQPSRPTSSTLIVVPPVVVPFVPVPIIPRVPDPPKGKDKGKPPGANPPALKNPKPATPPSKKPPSKPVRQNCAAGRIPDPANPGACKKIATTTPATTPQSATSFLKGLGGKVTIGDLETMKTKFPSFKWVIVGDKVLGMDWVHPGGAALLGPYVNEPRADIKKSAWGGQYSWHLDHPTVKSILQKNTIATIVGDKSSDDIKSSVPNKKPAAVEKPPPSEEMRYDPSATVAVDFTQRVGKLKPKYGTYRSEERDDWNKIYDVDRTLGPLNMSVNRFQISVQDAEISADGTWVDGKGTQRGILKNLEKASGAVLVTVGFPWTAKSQNFVKGGFADGSWKAYFSRVYATLAKSLHAAKTKPMLIEIFGEPDLELWNWVYGKDPRRVYELSKMVHDEFRKYPGFKIGGLGFACPEQNFVCMPRYIDNFIDYYQAQKMKFDFWSFHAYLGWTDGSDPSTYPPAPGPYNFGSRVSAFKDILKRRGLGLTPVMCTEYAWQDGDGSASWGFKEPGKSARGSMTDHRSAARTLHAIEIVRFAPYDVAFTFWAQGVGGSVAQPDGQKWGYSYNPLVVYHEGQWRYKASYYAFWMIGKFYESHEIRYTNTNPKLGVVTSANGIIVFNKSPQTQSLTVSLKGIAADRKCTMYLVNAKTYKTSRGGLDAVISGPTDPTPPRVGGVTNVGAALKALKTLGPEATACILFSSPIEAIT